MKRLSFALFFISLSVFSNTDRNCDISAPSTNLAACYESKSKQADAELNKAYNNLKSTLLSSGYDKQSKEKYWNQLVQSQRYWIKLRDAQCYARGAFFEDSSIAQLIEIKKCLMNVTKERVFFLNNEIQFIHDLP
ncbi:lysozyme inhibitor LprI family protein [Aeromonas hydrophila]|uniref:lysozyme inhibitor LprI family protein n=1 Tax=Aeromonas hydrophila TaxID=644 RepID=UPI0009B845A8|nr:lysozyme inhibitor LprI family protein [Aeromonas hydrophila]